jgi:hypothetical protein
MRQSISSSDNSHATSCFNPLLRIEQFLIFQPAVAAGASTGVSIRETMQFPAVAP